MCQTPTQVVDCGDDVLLDMHVASFASVPLRFQSILGMRWIISCSSISAAEILPRCACFFAKQHYLPIFGGPSLGNNAGFDGLKCVATSFF
jgi:hypothetical protein